MSKATEVYEALTAKLIESIENCEGRWVMPWTALSGGMPRNAVTNKTYNGVNFMILAWSGHRWWATYKQWDSLKAQVRKGEKGTTLVKWTEVEDKKKPGEKTLIPTTFTVFHLGQVDGAPERLSEPLPEPAGERNEQGDRLIAASPAKVFHGGDSAYYSPAMDTIHLPHYEQFRDAASYYSTAFHEMAHSTGHAQRLGRDLTGRFGSSSYAVEELVAEMSASFTACQVGTETAPREDHAQYLKHWLSVLREDARHIASIASAAQKATNFILALDNTPEGE